MKRDEGSKNPEIIYRNIKIILFIPNIHIQTKNTNKTFDTSIS